ncbi:hypothetical protein Pmani_013698 [Petrolisthes manimaculis]|uniref:CCHC-type domain-containing protein n=1 Tax=Petrolisthes manimaculis TaxID=1843537 RepID=A0AAE1PXU0_9EUCA|nr:hypothetical protein Pmani_013698 [Petrolisthes manimaculis]
MSGVRSVTELLEEASSLGYCGEELRKWIDRERTLERELERERDKEERDKRVAERELKRLELEARIEASKAAAAASAATVGQAGQPVSNVVSPPKLPPFDETRDDIDTYISRFERVAEAAGWSRTVWPTALASLLAGRALELYHQLTDDVVRNFEAFKAALLKGYDITPEGCRRQFRNTRFREGESAEQLVCRFKKSFTKWVETDGCHQTFVGISDLVVREQFIKQCPQPLAIFLKERKIKCLEDWSEEADRWIDAYGHPCTTSKPNRQPREIRHISREKTEPLPAREGATFHKDGWKSGAAACWRCGKVGHKQASCRAKGNQTTAATAGMVYAAVCPTPVYDLVVGGVYNETFHTNEQGVQKVQHVSQETPGNESDTEYEERRGFSAAVTRGQARNGQTSIKTLKSSIADTSDPDIGASAVIEDTDEVGNPLLPTLTAPAVWSEVKLANTLSVGEKSKVCDVLSKHSEIFSSSPRLAKVSPHEITLTDKTPVRSRSYPIPHNLKIAVEEEIESMESAGIIEKSDSPYNSPIVVVRKKDKGVRICGDFLTDIRVCIILCYHESLSCPLDSPAHSTLLPTRLSLSKISSVPYQNNPSGKASHCVLIGIQEY